MFHRIVFEVYVVASKYPDERVEARPELRDRETYYAELRFAVHCQSQSIPKTPKIPKIPKTPEAPQPRAAPDDESWDDLTARFGDTWT